MQFSEQHLKHLIVEAPMLEDVMPHEIESSAPLFADGLCLDSIDALDLAMAIECRSKVACRPDDEQNRLFSCSAQQPAAHVREHLGGSS